MADNTKKFWQGTNFWLALLILVGSFFGAPADLSNQVVTTLVGVIALIGSVRQFLPHARFGSIVDRLKDPNTWNYLLTFVGTIGIPKLSELIPPLHDLSDALISGNWGNVLSRGLSLLTIVYFLFFKKS